MDNKVSIIYVGEDEVRVMDGWNIGTTKDGRVYSLISKRWLSGHREKGTGYIIINDTNACKRDRLHRMVACSWTNDNVDMPVDWIVHHWDGDKANNHWENLVIMNRRQHTILHRLIDNYCLKYGAAATHELLAMLHEQFEPHKNSQEIWYSHIVSAFQC